MRKGWFRVVGVQDGDRGVEDQLKGLAPALAAVAGKTVLDLGCAEGLLAAEFARAGGGQVIGCDWLDAHVSVGRALVRGLPVTLLRADLNDQATHNWIGGLDFEVCLMLAILHKLRDPAALIRTVARRQPELIVVRLPPKTAPVIIDKRSGNRPCNVEAQMGEHGYALADVQRGHFEEWCGYFRRSA
jgi:SAM-dependent methyltransferase